MSHVAVCNSYAKVDVTNAIGGKGEATRRMDLQVWTRVCVFSMRSVGKAAGWKGCFGAVRSRSTNPAAPSSVVRPRRTEHADVNGFAQKKTARWFSPPRRSAVERPTSLGADCPEWV